jgi:hypothetical protein
MEAPSTSVDITRLNRKDRRKIMKSDKMSYMIPGRQLPFVKKVHGEITSFYELRGKEIQEENRQRQAANLQNAAMIGAKAYTRTAIPDKPIDLKGTATA